MFRTVSTVGSTGETSSSSSSSNHPVPAAQDLVHLGSGQEGLVFAHKQAGCYYKVLLWCLARNAAAASPGWLQQLQQLLHPTAVADAGGYTFGVYEVKTWGPHGIIRYGPYEEGERGAHPAEVESTEDLCLGFRVDMFKLLKAG